MPKSKRAKLVSLTKTKPARKENKAKLVEDVRAAASSHAAAYVFSYENMRTERCGLGRGWDGLGRRVGADPKRTPQPPP
jgi:hypothetical protein